jgi:hypothetical protein
MAAGRIGSEPAAAADLKKKAAAARRLFLCPRRRARNGKNPFLLLDIVRSLC